MLSKTGDQTSIELFIKVNEYFFAYQFPIWQIAIKLFNPLIHEY